MLTEVVSANGVVPLIVGAARAADCEPPPF
jgi:hypothetical protein